jgi:hypothetical protein
MIATNNSAIEATASVGDDNGGQPERVLGERPVHDAVGPCRDSGGREYLLAPTDSRLSHNKQLTFGSLRRYLRQPVAVIDGSTQFLTYERCKRAHSSVIEKP